MRQFPDVVQATHCLQKASLRRLAASEFGFVTASELSSRDPWREESDAGEGWEEEPQSWKTIGTSY